MPETYTRLTREERYQIYEGVTEKRSHCKIATLINKHHSTVSKEVERNTGCGVINPSFRTNRKLYNELILLI
jgi:IS30 family transposase